MKAWRGEKVFEVYLYVFTSSRFQIKQKIMNIKTLHEGKFIRLLSRGGWEHIQRTNCNGVAVMVALTEHEEILLVQQYRPPIDQDSIELPAGLIDDGEGPDGEDGLDAAKRELLEETGYVSDRWHEVFSGPGGAGASTDILYFYLAFGAKKMAEGGGDLREKIKVHKVAINDIDEWLCVQASSGVPVDPKIYAGLYLLNKYNKGAG